MNILNFSHPLSDAAHAALIEQCGSANAVVHTIPVQVDLAQPLAPQIAIIVADALEIIDSNPYNADVIIPPGLAIVAAQLVRFFPSANLAVIASTDGVPRQFLPTGELLRAVR